MTSKDVVEILDRLDAAGVRAWLDGGWGVDALIGNEIRPHRDLDVALHSDDLELARRVLEDHGFELDQGVEPGLPARLVMRDERERQVDFHPLLFDDVGNGWQQLSESGKAWGMYPADDLGATGVIGGRSVRCLSPRLQLRFRLGYEWSDRDEHDIRLLIERFHVPAPPSFREN